MATVEPNVLTNSSTTTKAVVYTIVPYTYGTNGIDNHGTVDDISQNGSDPEPDGDVIPGNNSDPTPIVTACDPVMTVSADDGNMCHPNITFNQTYQIVATAAKAASYLWTTNGTGTFSSITALAPTYTPSVSDVQDGQVQLTIMAISGGVCPNVVDKMILSIWTAPTVSITNATICVGSTYAVTGATAINSCRIRIRNL